MSRAARYFTAVVATLVLLALGLIYPAAMRGEALLSARWSLLRGRLTEGLPAWYMPTFLGFALLILGAAVLYTMTIGADDNVPRLLVPSVAHLTRSPRGLRTRLRDLPASFRVAALILGAIALARPENVLRGEESEDRGIDIVIVLDLSGSMKALMDAPVAPDGTPKKKEARLTRIETAKEVILDFVSRRKNDRIGVVVFGRSAYILSPPTLDKALLSALVEKMDLNIIDGNGTAIGDALGTAVARLRRSNARSKTVILLTDGDSNAGTIDPAYATHLAQTQGVKTYTVQIGNGDDVDIENGFDLFGQPRLTRVRFPVNPELLRKIAQDTGGEAFVATDKAGLEESMHRILDRLEKTRFEAQASQMEDLFPFFLLPAVALIALEAVVRLLVQRRFP
jgi:Ca-activated chloride channel family protein